MGTFGQMFCDTLRARGPSSFKIKKTKGHALANIGYLKQFPYLGEEVVCNNEADRYAGKAKFSFYNANHLLLSELLPKREAQYASMVRSVHNVIARVHMVSQQVRTTPAYKMASNIPTTTTSISHQLPPRHDEVDCTKFRFKVTRDTIKRYLTTAAPAS